MLKSLKHRCKLQKIHTFQYEKHQNTKGCIHSIFVWENAHEGKKLPFFVQFGTEMTRPFTLEWCLSLFWLFVVDTLGQAEKTWLVLYFDTLEC